MQKLKIKVSDEQVGNQAFRSFLEALPRTFNHEGTVVHSGRNVLRIIEAKGFGLDGVDRVMVKRYHGLLWFQKLDYTFIRKPKCRKAFDNTAELRRRGFDAARELAIVEVWNHGLYQYSFFVSEVGQGMRLDSLVVKLQQEGDKDTVDTLIQQYAALVRGLHEHGVLYWDMNCGNVLCSQKTPDAPWHFTLIDTNRAKFFDPNTPLDLNTVVGDLVLMNPKMGTVEQFQEAYLKQRGLYTPEEAQRIRDIQRRRQQKKRPLKNFMKRFKKTYYKWLEK